LSVGKVTGSKSDVGSESGKHDKERHDVDIIGEDRHEEGA